MSNDPNEEIEILGTVPQDSRNDNGSDDGRALDLSANDGPSGRSSSNIVGEDGNENTRGVDNGFDGGRAKLLSANGGNSGRSPSNIVVAEGDECYNGRGVDNGFDGGRAQLLSANGENSGRSPSNIVVADGDEEGSYNTGRSDNGIDGGRAQLLCANDGNSGRSILNIVDEDYEAIDGERNDNELSDMQSKIRDEFGVDDLPEDCISVYEEFYSTTAINSANQDSIIEEVQNPLADVSTEEQSKEMLEEWIQTGCGCHRNCTSKFSADVMVQNMLDCNELNYKCDSQANHQHLLLLGALNAVTDTSHEVKCQKPTRTTERKNTVTEYMFKNQSVCKLFFAKVHGCSVYKINNLKRHLKTHGIVPQQHGNLKNSHRSLPFEQKQKVVDFISAFAAQNALVLPGRTPNHQDIKIQLLPCSMNKRYVYDEYEKAITTLNAITIGPVESVSTAEAVEPVDSFASADSVAPEELVTPADPNASIELIEPVGTKPVTMNMWYKLWSELCPYIVIQKPRTDMCPTCQTGVLSLGNLAALGDKEKENRIKKIADHLSIVREEREYYKEKNKTITTSIKDGEIILQIGRNVVCSYTGQMHISFDFAQQVMLPHSSQQMGPLYFLSGYKVALFGIAIEPLGLFLLYIIPESCHIGKGSTVVISLLHHFFENYGLGETELFCHADNCSGQNKNNFLMQYFAWRILTGRHESIDISFLPVGHTKFSPDLYFVLFKKCFRKSEVNCLEDVVRCAHQATPKTKAIIPVLVGNEANEVFVKTYDWQTLFSQYNTTRIPSMLQYFHFGFSKNKPGFVTVKTRCNEKTVLNFKIMEAKSGSDDLPLEIVPASMTLERKKYLYEKIRPYTGEYAKDTLCPNPGQDVPNLETVLLQSGLEVIETQAANVNVDGEVEASNSTKPHEVEKKERKKATCGYCHEVGHTNRISKRGVYSCKKRENDEKESNSAV